MDTIFNFISANLDIKNKDDLFFPFSDYGFLYGYGLFETIKIQSGVPVLIDSHIARLREASIVLDIPFLYETSDIVHNIEQLVDLNKCKDAVLNIYLTPGDRGGDPAIHKIKNPFLLMVLRGWPDYDSSQRLVIDVREQSFQRTLLDRYKTLAWMKNCLEHRLSEGCDDVLLYDQEQVVLEASRSNVFFIKDDRLIMPSSKVILEGVTSQFVADNAAEFGFKLEKRRVFLDELPLFDDVFFTNALRGVAFVEKLGEFNLSSGEKAFSLQQKFIAKLS
tara:strand:- start:269 stop:1099 length:831 start_codon:yes stop_codon:yes gene_type:complete